MTRFDFEPLARLAANQYRDTNETAISDIGRVAARLDISRATVNRWQRDGLTHLQADRAACLLDMHPAAIWPHWLDDETDDLLLKPDRRSSSPQPPYQPCGTYAAARRHQRNGQELCADCRKVLRRTWARQRRAQRERAA